MLTQVDALNRPVITNVYNSVSGALTRTEDALGHATLPGICIAFLLAPLFGVAGRSLPVMLIGATIAYEEEHLGPSGPG